MRDTGGKPVEGYMYLVALNFVAKADPTGRVQVSIPSAPSAPAATHAIIFRALGYKQVLDSIVMGPGDTVAIDAELCAVVYSSDETDFVVPPKPIRPGRLQP